MHCELEHTHPTHYVIDVEKAYTVKRMTLQVLLNCVKRMLYSSLAEVTYLPGIVGCSLMDLQMLGSSKRFLAWSLDFSPIMVFVPLLWASCLFSLPIVQSLFSHLSNYFLCNSLSDILP